jgi:hypothetical protein
MPQSGVTATPVGAFSCAAVATAPSPNPAVPGAGDREDVVCRGHEPGGGQPRQRKPECKAPTTPRRFCRTCASMVRRETKHLAVAQTT